MIPQSYAAIAGGACTLIGTSTNLIVNGLVASEIAQPCRGMFHIAWGGAPAVLVVEPNNPLVGKTIEGNQLDP